MPGTFLTTEESPGIPGQLACAVLVLQHCVQLMYFLDIKEQALMCKEKRTCNIGVIVCVYPTFVNISSEVQSKEENMKQNIPIVNFIWL